MEQANHRDAVGTTHVKQTLTVVDTAFVVGLEYDHVGALKLLGVGPPPAIRDTEYRPGMLVG